MSAPLPPFARLNCDGILLEIYVQPGARTNEIAGLHASRLKLKIAAPPIDGEANRAVCAYIAELFATPRTHVRLLRGERSRQKTVVVIGATSLPACIGGIH